MLLKILYFLGSESYMFLSPTQGTGKLAIVDSFDTSKLLLVHNKFIQRVVGQKSNSRVFETLVREAIDTAFDGFIHNKAMRGETEKRIDHRLLIGNTILAIETDEFGHKRYCESQENARYDEFLTNTSHKFVFIRFNCDANMESSSVKTDFKYKLRVLLHTITTQISRIRHGQNLQRLEILKLFCCGFCTEHGRNICTCLKIEY